MANEDGSGPSVESAQLLRFQPLKTTDTSSGEGAAQQLTKLLGAVHGGLGIAIAAIYFGRCARSKSSTS